MLAEALPWLKKQGIWSRGRFGSYKYEVANQDHRYDAFYLRPVQRSLWSLPIVSHPPRFALCSCLIGVEAVDNMILGTKEFTLLYPSLTNEVGIRLGHLHAARFSSLV